MNTPAKKRRPGGSWPKAAFHIPDAENRCVREVRPKEEFDVRGFRYKIIGNVLNGSKLYGIVGCPTGQWDEGRGQGKQCAVPLRMHIAVTDTQGKESCDALQDSDFDQALEAAQARRSAIMDEADSVDEIDPVDYADGSLNGLSLSQGSRKVKKSASRKSAKPASKTKASKSVKKVSRVRRR